MSHGDAQVCIFFFFLGPPLWHMKVPRLGNCSRQSMPQSEQCRAAAVSLCHSQSNAGSEPYLGPALQVVAMPDPSPTE